MAAKYILYAVFLLVVISTTTAVPVSSNIKLPMWNHNDTDANRFYHSLSSHERVPFLLVELAHELLTGWAMTLDEFHKMPSLRIPEDIKVDESLYEKFQNMDIPKKFRRHLLRWVMETFHLSYSDVRDLIVYDQICAPDGTCFDTGDVGDLCCPF